MLVNEVSIFKVITSDAIQTEMESLDNTTIVPVSLITLLPEEIISHIFSLLSTLNLCHGVMKSSCLFYRLGKDTIVKKIQMETKESLAIFADKMPDEKPKMEKAALNCQSVEHLSLKLLRSFEMVYIHEIKQIVSSQSRASLLDMKLNECNQGNRYIQFSTAVTHSQLFSKRWVQGNLPGDEEIQEKVQTYMQSLTHSTLITQALLLVEKGFIHEAVALVHSFAPPLQHVANYLLLAGEVVSECLLRGYFEEACRIAGHGENTSLTNQVFGKALDGIFIDKRKNYQEMSDNSRITERNFSALSKFVQSSPNLTFRRRSGIRLAGSAIIRGKYKEACALLLGLPPLPSWKKSPLVHGFIDLCKKNENWESLVKFAGHLANKETKDECLLACIENLILGKAKDLPAIFACMANISFKDTQSKAITHYQFLLNLNFGELKNPSKDPLKWIIEHLEQKKRFDVILLSGPDLMKICHTQGDEISAAKFSGLYFSQILNSENKENEATQEKVKRFQEVTEGNNLAKRPRLQAEDLTTPLNNPK